MYYDKTVHCSGSAMVSLDEALTSYQAFNNNHFAICSGLAAICNAKFPPALVHGNSFPAYLL